MSPLPRALALITALAAATPAFAKPMTRTHALVVTNNRSLDPTRPDLHYADDDGAKYAELFAQFAGLERVTLLTTMDAESRRLHPAWAERAREPSRAGLFAEVERLAKTLASDAAEGVRTDVLLVFAGHGDIAQGEGFIELSDGRLTAKELDEQIVSKLPAKRLHLVLDSCNSWFMLSPRKPGGKRWETSAQKTVGLLERHPHVGAIVSTSAEAVTYEWSELQSGIFSYEVRSGLRGAADADADGTIRYSELAAFLRVANQAIPNDLYRPRVYARGPGGNTDEPLVALTALSSEARRLEIASEGQRRFTIRNGLGVRVLDVHKASGTALRLLLPSEDQALQVSERVEDPATRRPTDRHRSIPPGGELFSLDALEDSATIAGRGEAPIFRALFEQPFGLEAWKADLAQQSARPEAPPQGVSRKDAEQLRLHLAYAADGARSQRLAVSFGALSTGAMLTAFSVAQNTGDVPFDTHPFETALWSVGPSLMLSGLIIQLIPDEQETLARKFTEMDVSTESARSTAVLGTEREFEMLAVKSRQYRHLGAGILGTMGAVYVGLGAYQLASRDYSCRDGSECGGLFGSTRAFDVLMIGGGLTLLAQSLYIWLVHEYPVEKAWRFYQQDVALGREGEAAPANPVKVTPSVSILPSGGSVGLSVRF